MGNQDVCIIIRGELLRPINSHYHYNNKSKELRNPDLSDQSFRRQNDIMESIINHIIIPYKKLSYNVFVSGCAYECPNYDNKLTEYFPTNTIKFIKPGETNQSEMFSLSIEHAGNEHPNCTEYISIRADYIMLQNVVIKHNAGLYTGFAWENTIYPDVDVFFVIPRETLPIFERILKYTKSKDYTDTHYIIKHLKNENIVLYPIWENYKDGATGINYNEYTVNIDIHKNRPFVNYMRDRQ